MTETKINLNLSNNFLIPQYLFLNVDSKTNTGGVAHCIKENIKFNIEMILL